MTDRPEMLEALAALRDALRRARLPLQLPGVEGQRALQRELADQLDDYILPRVRSIDAPLLCVVGGSTGAGKSTLVNSLVGTKVTEPGLLRPTTRSPVLVCHPDDAAWFGPDRVLPELERVDRPTDDPGALQLVSVDVMPRGLAILDAPDVDSVEDANRALAAQLLAAADLWLFVTSAARYADAVPWEFLRAAAERSAAVAIVLDRTPADAIDTVAAHLARMLAARGLRDSPLFTIPEKRLGEGGLLTASAVADVRGWLQALGSDADARALVVRQTLQGAVRNVAFRAHDVADGCAAQASTATSLREHASEAYDEAVRRVVDATADGTLLRGEVLARWQEFVGTGELMRSLETRVGWLRDRLVNAVKGKPQQADRVTVAVESGLETLVLEHAEAAAERTAGAWATYAPGKALLDDSDEDLSRASRALRRRTERTIRDWQADVLELVRTEGADKRGTARFLAFGVNGLSVTLMIVVFAHTGGLVGAEAGIAGGSAVLGQKLLEAVFGDQAVRALVSRARRMLDERLRELLADEVARYTSLIDGLQLSSDTAPQIRAAARRVDDLRFSMKGAS